MTTSRIIDATCGNVAELKYPQKLKHTKGITGTARRIVKLFLLKNAVHFEPQPKYMITLFNL